MDLWCIRRVCRRFVERGENRADTDMDSFSNCKMHRGSVDKYSWVLTLHAISLQSIPQTHGWKVASSNSSRNSKRIFSPELTLFPGSSSVSVPVLQQWHVKDPGPSSKYADGRLHLDTHTPLAQQSWSGMTTLLSLSWTALANARHASLALSNTVPFICVFTSGNRKSRRERALMNTVGMAAAAPCSHWDRQLSLLLCVHWRYHDEEKGHGVPCLGGALTKLWRPSGDSDAHNSPQWLSVCPQEKWWWHSPLFRRSWFSDHINRFKFRQMSALLRSILNGLPWSFTTWTCSTQP